MKDIIIDSKANFIKVYEVQVNPRISYTFYNEEDAKKFRSFVLKKWKAEGIEVDFEQDIDIATKVIFTKVSPILNSAVANKRDINAFLEYYLSKKENG